MSCVVGGGFRSMPVAFKMGGVRTVIWNWGFDIDLSRIR